MNPAQHRVAVAVAVLGAVGVIAAACISRKDIVPPIAPGPVAPQPAPAHYGLHVWSIPNCTHCVSLHAELRKPEAQAALARFAVVEDEGGGLAALRWSVHGYPTMIVTDQSDREIGRHEGELSAHALAAWLDGFR